MTKWQFHNQFCLWLLRELAGRWEFPRPKWQGTPFLMSNGRPQTTRNLYRCNICGVYFLATLKSLPKRHFVYSLWNPVSFRKGGKMTKDINYPEEIREKHTKKILEQRKQRTGERRKTYDLNYFDAGGEERRSKRRERRAR